MGEAFREGERLGEAYGATKAEVLKTLEERHPDADEIRIRSVGRTTRPAMIDKPFAYHKPSEDGHARITRLREAFSVVQRAIEETCPPSRQKSVAITELETSAMWAIKAVVFNDPKSEAETLDVEIATPA